MDVKVVSHCEYIEEFSKANFKSTDGDRSWQISQHGKKCYGKYWYAHDVNNLVAM